MIVEVADAGDFVPGFLVDRVVDNDAAVLCPPRLTVFLQFFEPFVVELIFVPVVLCEELVERAFAVRWKDFPCDPRHGLVAASNKTCDVGFRVLGLMIRE